MSTKTVNFRVKTCARNTLTGLGLAIVAAATQVSRGDAEALGYACTSIAQWDCAPSQAIATTYRPGFIAFHIEGIEAVWFIANNAPAVIVDSMAYNPDSGVVEYFPVFDPTAFPDGPVNVRAKAIPTNGKPRVMDLLLYANSSGTLTGPHRYVSPDGFDTNNGLTADQPKLDPATAFASMAVDGVIPANAHIYLLPGASTGASTWVHPGYPFSGYTQATGPFVKICPAPGYTRDDVSIRTDPTAQLAATGETTPYMMALSGVIFEDVTFNDGLIPFVNASGTRMVFNRIKLDGGDRFILGPRFALNASPGGQWLIDSIVTNVQDGPQGFTLVRNVTVTNTLTGGCWNCLCVANTTVSNINLVRASGTNGVVDSSDDSIITLDGYTPDESDPEKHGGLGDAAPVIYPIGYGNYVRILDGSGNILSGVGGQITGIVGGGYQVSGSFGTAGATGLRWELYNGAHPDLWRTQSSASNIIVYGYRTPDWSLQRASQGLVLFSRGFDFPLYEYTDMAIVDCDISAYTATLRLGGVLRHVYIKGNTIRGSVGVAKDVPGLYDIDATTVLEGNNWMEYASNTPTDTPDIPGATFREAA